MSVREKGKFGTDAFLCIRTLERRKTLSSWLGVTDLFDERKVDLSCQKYRN